MRAWLLALALLVAGCSRATAKTEEGRARIVAVGSAVTETLYALGDGAEVVAVDTSSLFPEAATKLPQIGYQRTISVEGVLAQKPTLVIGSAEAGPPAAIEQLRAAGVRVETLPNEPTVAGARARIAKIAALVHRDPAHVLATFDAEVARAKSAAAGAKARPKVLAIYARGTNAMQVFGTNTATASMLELAGADNAVTEFEGSRPLTAEALVKAAPDVILVPTRGLGSLGGAEGLLKVPGVAETPAGKNRRIVEVDDLLLLGFGPRTGQAAIELYEKLHPEPRG